MFDGKSLLGWPIYGFPSIRWGLVSARENGSPDLGNNVPTGFGSLRIFQQLDVLELDSEFIMCGELGKVVFYTKHCHDLQVGANRHTGIADKTLFIFCYLTLGNRKPFAW